MGVWLFVAKNFSTRRLLCLSWMNRYYSHISIRFALTTNILLTHSVGSTTGHIMFSATIWSSLSKTRFSKPKGRRPAAETTETDPNDPPRRPRCRIHMSCTRCEQNFVFHRQNANSIKHTRKFWIKEGLRKSQNGRLTRLVHNDESKCVSDSFSYHTASVDSKFA